MERCVRLTSTVLIAGLLTASITLTRAAHSNGGGPGARQSCVLVEVEATSAPKTYTALWGNCIAPPRTAYFGVVKKLPDDVASLQVNHQAVGLRACKAEELPVDPPSEAEPPAAVGQGQPGGPAVKKASPPRCFDIVVSGATSVGIKIDGWTNKGTAADDSKAVDALTVPGTPAQPTGPAVQKKPPAEETPCQPLSCESSTDCAAYRDGVTAAGICSSLEEYNAWKVSHDHVYKPEHNRAVLFVDGSGSPVGPFPHIDEDDTVVVVAIPAAGKEIQELRLTTCGAPKPVRVDGGAVVRPAAAPPPDPEARHRLIRAKECSADEGIKVIVRQSGSDSSNEVKVPTLALHTITIGLGLIYDFALTREFRASSVKGEAVPVIISDEHLRGISPPVPFVFWRPWKVTKQKRRPWPPDFLGIGLGVSLVEPLDHLYLGALLEPYPGLGLIGGYHFQTIKTLANGYHVGDRFPAGDVPVDRRWNVTGEEWFAGVYVDAALFSNLLKAIQ